jgi:ATP-binding cassette subfamily B protein
VIKSFQSEEKMTDKQQTFQEDVNQAQLKKAKLSILSSSGINLFFAFGYAFVLIFGGYQLQYGLSVGYLIAMIQLVQLLQSPFSGLSLLYPKYQNTLASINRLEKLELLPVDDTKVVKIKHFDDLVAHKLNFSYDHQKVINDLSFHIKKNQIILVKGPSGTGKTTLMKILLGLLSQDSGTLDVIIDQDKMRISSMTRSLFSYVPQDNLILSGTIRDNLNLFEYHDEVQLYQVLKDVSLFDIIHEHPLKLDMPLKEKGVGLSEGQIQRLAIARALLKDAPILLLDEVTSSLDHELELSLSTHLKLLKEKTILLITHHELSNDIFDQVIHINKS